MRMISLPNACYVAQRPYSQLYALALRGRLGAKRIGARWFVSEAACLDLEQSARATAGEKQEASADSLSAEASEAA